jgi:hypothetical protein
MPPKDNDNPESSTETKDRTASGSKREEDADAPRVIKPEYEGLLHENGGDSSEVRLNILLFISTSGVQQSYSGNLAGRWRRAGDGAN